MPGFFLVMCQAGGLKPYQKREFDADVFFLLMLQNFQCQRSWKKYCRQILKIKQKLVFP